MPEIILIAAVSENGVIGKEGTMPWHIPADLRRFKHLTLGYPVLMGRKTFESLGRRPLPGRLNVVISSTRSFEGVENFPTPEEALNALAQEEKIFVIGGSTLYHHFLPQAQRLELTHVKITCPGDTYFPLEYLKAFKLIKETDLPAEPEVGLPYRCVFSTYLKQPVV